MHGKARIQYVNVLALLRERWMLVNRLCYRNHLRHVIVLGCQTQGHAAQVNIVEYSPKNGDRSQRQGSRAHLHGQLYNLNVNVAPS